MTIPHWQLERLAPAKWRGARLELDPGHPEVRVGRSAESAIRLYSASASRLHAHLRCDDQGVWWLIPEPGRVVLADGEPAERPVELCEGLTLTFGSDRLRCQTPTEVDEVAFRPHERELFRARVGLGLIVVALVAVVLALVWRIWG